MGYTLITGATSDIGIQICKTLEKSGHSLLMTDLKHEALEDLKTNYKEKITEIREKRITMYDKNGKNTL